jgi:hypothetical protein
MFDIGVLWSGDHLFPGTVETLEMLRSNGMRTPAGEELASYKLISTRQAGRFRHEQQHKVTGRLQKEAGEAGDS